MSDHSKPLNKMNDEELLEALTKKLLTPSVKFKRMPDCEDIPLPAYQTPEAAGIDLYAVCDGPAVSIGAGQCSGLIGTGFCIEIPAGWEAQIRIRSSMALKHGIFILNSPATIDSDYRGEVKLLLFNTRPNDYVLKRGDRIAQMILSRAVQATIKEVSSLNTTVRGADGYGSTGTR